MSSFHNPHSQDLMFFKTPPCVSSGPGAYSDPALVFIKQLFPCISWVNKPSINSYKDCIIFINKNENINTRTSFCHDNT